MNKGILIFIIALLIGLIAAAAMVNQESQETLDRVDRKLEVYGIDQ